MSTSEGTRGSTQPDCSDHLNLELVPLDIWGRDIVDGTLTVDTSLVQLEADDLGPEVMVLPLDGDTVFDVTVQAPDHVTAVIRIESDGLTADGTYWEILEGSGRVTFSEETRIMGSGSCLVTSVYIGLDHDWFAATGRAPSHNEVDLLMDGQEYWGEVAEDVAQADESVMWSTWFWESDFELVRPDDHVWSSEQERWENTAMGLLDSLDGVDKRVLVFRAWSDNTELTAYLNTDHDLRARAGDPLDEFDVILQGNPEEVPLFGEWEGEAVGFDFGRRVLSNPRYAGRDIFVEPDYRDWTDFDAASWHQKSVVVDDQVAFVSGFNTFDMNWDSSDHRLFDPKRMSFESDRDDRLEVLNGEVVANVMASKDYGVRVVGPAVADVNDVMWQRWEHAIANEALYSENVDPFELGERLPEVVNGVPLQVVATMPQPWSEQSISETHAKAFANAQDFIYIEDQYFRSPELNHVIVDRMTANPDLLLIVVTEEVMSYDPSCMWTDITHQTFQNAFPDRYIVLQTRNADIRIDEGWFWDDVDVLTDNIYVHSKMRIIDDNYLSVGSANYNNRSYLYEGELNVAVLDEGFTKPSRERIFANLVGETWAHLLNDDAQNNMDVLRMAADSNAEVIDWWEDNAFWLDADEARDVWSYYRPSGLVYPLEVADSCWFEVGPDFF
jgi:phosphatidylserine/phosphatidylglycerophosphate/cardiolipin synthase-like enzyme